MPALPLRIAQTAPDSFKDIARHIDAHLADVHSMLRLPVPAREDFPAIDAGCNFAIAGTLLSVAAGLSTMVYVRTKRNAGECFTRLFEEFYPWDEDPPANIDRPRAAKILYDTFRNAHAHALNIATAYDKRGFLRSASASVGIMRYGEGALSEGQVRALEESTTRPWLPATLSHVPSHPEIRLLVDPFYWGVRRMVEAVSTNAERMKVATWFLGETEEQPEEVRAAKTPPTG